MISRLLKTVFKRLAHRCGYEVVRPEWLSERAFAHHLRCLFAQYRIDCVLDVGANRGQYRQFLRDAVGYQGLVVSFEPLRRNVEILASLAENQPHWVICGHALGSRDGPLDIHVMRADNFSSFRQPDSSLVDRFRALNVVDHDERVEVKRLDKVLPGLREQHGFRNVFLKMDTQGFDLEVVAGAGDALASIRALQTELSVRRIYSDMPDYREVLQSLARRGFDITGMFPVTADAAMRVIEFDCIMVNGTLAAPDSR